MKIKTIGIFLLLGLFTVAISRSALSWTAAANLNIGRDSHTATLLSNGNVLVVGGWDSDAIAINSCEVYNPTTDTWSSTGSLSVARFRHTATLLSNGNVLVVGGQDNNGDSYDSIATCEVYNPTAGTWSSTGSLSIERVSHRATLLSNGNVLVAGGWDNNGDSIATCEVYNPTAGTWSSTGSLSTARDSHTATLLSNGNILVAGGEDNAANVIALCEVYNPTAGTWSSTGNLNVNRWRHTATLLSNGNVLVAGGQDTSNYLNSSEIFNSSSGVWSSAANLNTKRIFHTSTLLGNGNVLVTGGETLIGGTPNYLSSCEIYDISTGSWTNTANLSLGKMMHTATLLGNGKVLVAGGTNGTDSLSSCEFYDPVPVTPSTFSMIVNTANQLTYTWSDNSANETGFRILDENGAVKAAVSANTTTASESGLLANKQYTRKVAAYNGTGTSPSSDGVSKYTSIEASTGATFEGITDTQITIHSSNAPSNLSSDNSGILFTNTTKNESSGWIKSNTWTNSGLSANTQYNFTIATRNGNGIITATVEVGSQKSLEKPSAGSFSVVTTTAITANWTGNAQLTEYYCENVTATTNSGWITGLSWRSTTLEADTEYEFRVKGRKSSTEETEWVSLGKQKTGKVSTMDIIIGDNKVESGDPFPQSPEIKFKIELDEGVTVKVKKVLVDGEEVNIIVGTSGINIQALATTSLTIKFKEPLTPGTHDIKILIEDSKGTVYIIEKKGLKVASAGSEGTSSGPSLAYPNPYNPSAGDIKLTYYLSKDTGTMIYIFDTSGRLVWQNRFVSGDNGGKAGYNDVGWNGKDLMGNVLPNDVYICRIINSETNKIISNIRIAVLKK